MTFIATGGYAIDSKKPSESVPLKFMEVTDAYQVLKDSFPDIANVVRSIQIDKNTLTLDLTHVKAAAVLEKLAEIDVRPKQIYISAEVTELPLNPDGESKEPRVIARPSIYCQEDKPATLLFGSKSKACKLTITATSLADSGQIGSNRIILRSVVSDVTSGASAEKEMFHLVDYALDGVPIEITQRLDNGKLQKVTVTASSLPRVAAK